MFVMTAKLNKKKLTAVLLTVILLIVAIVVLLNVVGGSSSQKIRSSDDAAAYLRSLGWQVSPTPLEVQQIVIPRDFSGVYESYIALQHKQGFKLEEYGGMSATRYTFRILNYPSGEDCIVADIIVYGSGVIAGDVQSTAIDGFMEGLRDNAPSPSGQPK
ncbi:MAG: DUF4830 domain-containing protein [Clostridiales bacterium]|nr:DUF4830 domain-containing protein [Clostridiales bacterium]